MARTSKRGAEWEKQRQRVLDRDGWTCQYCHKFLEGDDATVDHIDPVSLNPGRKYNDDELIAACRGCNGRKSDKLIVRIDYRSPDWFGDAA